MISALKTSKLSKSLYFIYLCLMTFSKSAKNGFIFCAAAVLIAKIATVIQPIVLGNIVDSIHKFSSNKNDVLLLVLFFCSLGLISSIMLAIKNYYILLLRERIGKDLSLELLKRIQQFSHSFFHQNNVSKISEINNMGQNALHGFMVAFLSDIIPFIFEVTLIFVVIASKFYAVISLPLIAVFMLYIGANIYFSPKERESISTVTNKKLETASQFYENIINFDTIKSTRSEKYRLEKFEDLLNQLIQIAKKHGKLFSTKSIIQSTTLSIGLFAVLSIATIAITQGKITVGDFVILNAYFIQITAPLVNIMRSYDIFNKSLTDIDPLKDLILRKPDLTVIEPRSSISEQNCSVQFHQVHFSYNNETTLDNINLILNPGKKLSIVGPSGGGKSTIVKLLMRYYDPTKGIITINNRDIRTLAFSELRKVVGYIPQNIDLLNDTVLNNITLGNDAIDLSTVLNKTRDSGIIDFITSMKKGFQTIVGDRGLQLSGGEKQRIGIVRALVRDPDILILDEYNAALDIQTEEKINSYINSNSLNCSVILVAHRLPSVINSDEIIVVENGRITQRGKHVKLMHEPGWYQRAWKLFLKNNESDNKVVSIATHAQDEAALFY